jgi:hypothetical protein
MQRVRIEKPRPRRERWWLEVLPLDPRDPDVRRAKGLISNAHPHERGPMTAYTTTEAGREGELS